MHRTVDRTMDMSVDRVVVVFNRQPRQMQVAEIQHVIAILIGFAVGCRFVSIIVIVGVGSFRAARDHSLRWHAIWRSAIYDSVVIIYLLGVCGGGADFLDHFF